MVYIGRLSSAAELERTNNLKKKLTEWDFNAHDLSEEDQLRCVVIIFEHVLGLKELKDLHISPNQLHQFIFAIMKSYHDTNPYHNFVHAVDVLQAMFHFLCLINLIPSFFPSGYEKKNQQRCIPDDLLKGSDAFALLLASIGHDVGHPGVNNHFLVESQTPLAQLYNDTSVLESFHAMTLFNLMRKHGFKVYETETTKYKEFRKTVVNAILATDMDIHNDYIADIEEHAKKFKSSDPQPRLKSPEILSKEKKTITGALIKCADISNVARPYHIAESWSNVLMEEFRCQGDLQRKLGLPVHPLNDRHGSLTQSDSQIFFIDNYAMPLFKSVGDLLPEMSFSLKYLENNRKSWQECKNVSVNDRSHRHNSSGNDSGVIVSPIDSRQNSPIVAVPAAMTMHRQVSGSCLRPISTLPERPGSEAHSDDFNRSNVDEVLSNAGASDAPLVHSNSHSKQQSFGWSLFARSKSQTVQNTNQYNGIPYEQGDRE
ncbi:9029_t:CDS:2, partial [Acaulospora colombiana]